MASCAAIDPNEPRSRHTIRPLSSDLGLGAKSGSRSDVVSVAPVVLGLLTVLSQSTHWSQLRLCRVLRIQRPGPNLRGSRRARRPLSHEPALRDPVCRLPGCHHRGDGRSAAEVRSQHEEWVRLPGLNPEEAAKLLLRDLRSSRNGLSSVEAQRRLSQYGPNELRRRGGRRWPRELARQFTHPLALLLWIAALLLILVGSNVVAIAVLAIIVLNATFAFVQEMQAERAVEALAQFIPQRARAMRDGASREIDAVELVPGDVVVLEEGDRIAADIRLLSGAIEVDMSALTGESVPALRSASILDVEVPLLVARDLVFSGTNCTGGEAQGVVFATGMTTELGRIAALSERVTQDPSPLESQVRRVAWLIAAVAVGLALAFIPFATFAAGLSLVSAVVFAVGLVAGLVPEGLLPVITLALAVAVRALARRGAVVKRLSAVETLGSTDVICTDKTGTLTENRMEPTLIWTAAASVKLGAEGAEIDGREASPLRTVGQIAAACNNARLEPDEEPSGDPTEIAVLLAAQQLGADVAATAREARRRWQFHFDPERKLMSTIDTEDGQLVVHTKGAPEALLPLCSTLLGRTASRSNSTTTSARGSAIRLIGAPPRACASWLWPSACLPAGEPAPHRRADAERGFCFAGLIAMRDPPRPAVADAVARCHTAGIRILVITGDHPLTAAAIARQVGIARADPTVINGEELDRLDDRELGNLVRGDRELIFARASPEAKLRIADALRELGHVVAYDRRRSERRPGPTPRRHRHRDGALGDRRRPRGLDHGAHRRRLRDHRRCRPGGPAGLRQRPQVHPVHLRPRHARGDAVPGLRSGRGRDPAAADHLAAARL